MGKITRGYSRKIQKASLGDGREIFSVQIEKLFCSLGLFAVAVMLAFPVFSREESKNKLQDDAVAVMSTAVGDREEVALPDEPTAAELGEKSFYDFIGEFFRDLIYG